MGTSTPIIKYNIQQSFCLYRIGKAATMYRESLVKTTPAKFTILKARKCSITIGNVLFPKYTNTLLRCLHSRIADISYIKYHPEIEVTNKKTGLQ